MEAIYLQAEAEGGLADEHKALAEGVNAALNAARRSLKKPVRRKILEFCAGENSLIGAHAPADCEVIRLTEKINMASPEGLAFAQKAMKGPEDVELFASIPCVGGCPLRHINAIKSKNHVKRQKRHLALYHKLWDDFAILARRVIAQGGKVVIEWPRGCEYWKDAKVIKLCEELGLQQVDFDGCAFGLKDHVTGEPIKKPWRIRTP